MFKGNSYQCGLSKVSRQLSCKLPNRKKRDKPEKNGKIRIIPKQGNLIAVMLIT